MCLFKKKKPKWIETAKYKKDDFVNFRYRNDLWFGYIWEAFLDNDGNVIYTIQIGGQCPSFVYKIPESTIIGIKKR